MMNDIIALAKRIDLSEETIESLRSFSGKNQNKINTLASKCRNGCFSCLAGKNDMLRLAVILKLALEVKEKYAAAGIDEKIYYDTMSDIKIWCDKTGGRGLKNYGWIKNHVNFELFRLGRLQFQIYPCNNKTLLYKNLPFSFGENLIYVHIPEGEPLYEDRCMESFLKAVSFFGEYFSSYNFRFFFCESWLLYDGNRDFMTKDSNIVQFMNLFDCRYSLKIDIQAIERIYGKRHIFIKSYPEKTSLQRRAKEYMLSGGRLGIGVGIIEKDKYKN